MADPEAGAEGARNRGFPHVGKMADNGDKIVKND
jgi:hypothetical protein